MSDEIVTFEDAAQKLRDQIKTAYVDSIPDKQWEDMVKAELARFFETRKGGYGNRDTIESHFTTQCREMFREQLKEVLGKHFRDNNEQLTKQFLEFVKNNQDEVFRQFGRSVIDGLADNIGQSIGFNIANAMGRR